MKIQALHKQENMEPTQGQVVEFLESQRFVCGIVLGKKGSRYHLLTHLGREVNLASGRLLHVKGQIISASSREERIRCLQKLHKLRDQLKEQVDIRELWELVSGEKDLWSPEELAELAFSGQIKPDHSAALIRAVIEDHTYFKFREGMITVQSPEAVERLLVQRAAERERLERLSQGSKWLEQLWSSEKDQVDKACSQLSDPHIAFWIKAIKDFCVRGDDSEHAAAVRALFRQTGLGSSTAPFDTMVRAGIWHQDQNLELLRHQVQVQFPEEVLKQAQQLARTSQQGIFEENRKDLTDLYAITIDGPESLDLDDAISFRRMEQGLFEIGIHITDIGLLIEPGTPLFKEAIHRATSIYLPDQKISMIPEILSQGVWSLEEGEYRRALSFLVVVDEQGRIVREQVLRSIIKVDKRLTYEDAEELIASETDLTLLHKICEQRQDRRIDQGALPLPIPELVIEVDEKGRVEVRLSEPGPARFLIAECMILANDVAARFLRDRGIPALYRSQAPPREKIIKGYELDLMANYRQRRLISRGLLGPEPEMHHGLGLEVYTTVTSPLRRALDLLMQQQITSFLKDKMPLHSQEDLEQLSMLLQQGLMSAAAVRQARTRYWLLRHLEQRKGEVLDAWILEVGPRKVMVVLKDYLVPVELPMRNDLALVPDQLVKVKIKRVSPRENILKMDWGENR